MICGIPASEAWRFRQQIEHFAARSFGRWQADALEDGVMRGERQLYADIHDGAIRAVMMTSVDAENVYVDAVTGVDRAEWIAPFEAMMTQWAKATGRKRVIAFARPGWAREARELGYREAHREFVREVE